MNDFITSAELAATDSLNRPSTEFDRFIGPALTPEMVAVAEANLSVKLPAALIDLLRQQNGGFLRRSRFVGGPEKEPYIEVRQLNGLGYDSGIDGEFGSHYMAEEWGYPKGLVWLAGDGHSGVFLDYRSCGPQGEPLVIWLDMECDPMESFQLAPNFAGFLLGLTAPE